MNIEPNTIADVLTHLAETKDTDPDKKTPQKSNWPVSLIMKILLIATTSTFTLGYAYRSYEDTMEKINELDQTAKAYDKKIQTLEKAIGIVEAKIDVVISYQKNPKAQ